MQTKQQPQPADSSNTLARDYEKIFDTAEGRNVLKDLMHRAGFLCSNIVLDASGNINLDAMRNNEAQRALYLYIRSYMPESVLFDVEIKKEPKNAEQTDP